MPFRQTAAFLALLSLPYISSAQDKDLDNTIDNFKGMSGQLKDQIPGANESGVLGSMLRGKQKIDGAGQTQIKLSQEQQDYLDRQQMSKDKAAAAAKAAPGKSKQVAKRAPARVVEITPPVPAVASVVPAAPVIEYLNPESLSKVAPGVNREVVLASLGKPRHLTRISGLDDGVHETMVYFLDLRHKASIRLVDGKVQSIIR